MLVYSLLGFCSVLFSSSFSYSHNVKIRVIKRLVVKLEYKQGGKAATETVRLRFRLGLGDPR